MAPPQLRGLLRKRIMRDIAIGFILSIGGANVYWFGIAVPRRKAYEEFYRTYEPPSSHYIEAKDGEF